MLRLINKGKEMAKPEEETPQSKALEQVTLGEVAKEMGEGFTAQDAATAVKLAVKGGNMEEVFKAQAAMAESIDKMATAINEISSSKENEKEAAKFESLEKELEKYGRLDPVNNKEHADVMTKLSAQYGATQVDLANKGGLMKLVHRPVDKRSSRAEEEIAIKEAWDMAYTLTEIYGGVKFSKSGAPVGYDFNILESQFQRLRSLGNEAAGKVLESGILRTAQDTTTAGEGLEWIPVGYSSEMTERVYLQLRVANLFNRFQMAAKSVERPYAVTRGTAFLMPESAADTDIFTTKARPSLTATGSATFTAKKLASLRFWSQEVEQDSIVPLLQTFLLHLAYSQGRGIEEALLNGSTATNDLDNAASDGSRLWANTGDPASVDARKLCNGIRKQILGQDGTNRIDASNSSADFLKKMRSLRGPLGEAGAMVDRLVYILGTDSHIHLMNDANVITVDKYANNATVLSGEIAQVDNISCVLSPAQRNDYTAAGVYDGGDDRTLLHCVHRDFFEIGDRLAPQIVQGFMDLSQQGYLMILQRLDFQRIINDEYACATELYNIPRA